MHIKVDFCLVEEPGEYIPPKIVEKISRKIDVPAVPRYQDQIEFLDKKYFVHDVIYKTKPQLEGLESIYEAKIKVIAYHSLTRAKK